MYRKEKLPNRNDRCPCGSGKKAKRCCLRKMEQFVTLPPNVRERLAVAAILGHDPLVDARPSVPEIIRQHFDDLTIQHTTLESTNVPIPVVSTIVSNGTPDLPDA